MTNEESNVLTEKISRALALSFKKLVEKTKKEDGELLFSKDGVVIRVKARDLK